MAGLLWAGLAAAADTPATAPALPADTLAMLTVRDAAGLVGATEMYVRAAAGDFAPLVLPFEPGGLQAHLRAQGSLNNVLLSINEPFAVLFDNYIMGADPVLAFVLRPGALEDAAERFEGLEVKAPAEAGAPWVVGQAGNAISANVLPLADGWVVATQKAADAKRLAAALAGWTPAAAGSAVELSLDFAKTAKLQGATIGGLTGMLPMIMQMGLAEQAKELENEAARLAENPDDRRARRLAVNRALLEMGNRGAPLAAARLGELVAALPQLGVVNLRLDVDGENAVLNTDWFPAPGSAAEKMLGAIAALPPADPAFFAKLPENAVMAYVMADTAKLPGNPLEEWYTGLLGDAMFTFDGEEESRARVRGLFADISAAGRGRTVAAITSSPERGLGTLNFMQGGRGGEIMDKGMELANFVLPKILAFAGIATPEMEGKLDISVAAAPLPEPVEGVAARRFDFKIDLAPELQQGLPPQARRMIDAVTANPLTAQTAEKAGDWWVYAGGEDWQEALRRGILAAKGQDGGFGKRPGFEAAVKELDGASAVSSVVYLSDALVAFVRNQVQALAKAMGAAEISAEARQLFAAIPAGRMPMTLSEESAPGMASVRWRIPAQSVRDVVGAAVGLQAAYRTALRNAAETANRPRTATPEAPPETF